MTPGRLVPSERRPGVVRLPTCPHASRSCLLSTASTTGAAPFPAAPGFIPGLGGGAAGFLAGAARGVGSSSSNGRLMGRELSEWLLPLWKEHAGNASDFGLHGILSMTSNC